MPYKPEVIADNSGEWCGNALVFETEVEALDYACDLAMRWAAVRDTRATYTDEPINRRMVDGRLEVVTVETLKFDRIARDRENFRLAMLDAETESLESLQTAAEIFDSLEEGS